MFIELLVKRVLTVHGYGADHQEVVQEIAHATPVRKLVPLSRIQSVGEQFVLVSAGFGRHAYWEYEGEYAQLRDAIGSAGLLAGPSME
jgi:hypothetical protein